LHSFNYFLSLAPTATAANTAMDYSPVEVEDTDADVDGQPDVAAEAFCEHFAVCCHYCSREYCYYY
jgi:hypothetical protein